jgi:periplasmic protein TonB
MYASPKRSTLISGLLHAGAIALILAATGVKIPPVTPQHTLIFTPTDIYEYIPRARLNSDGAGGGGVGSDTPASRGPLPRVALKQFTAPVAKYENLNPILSIEPTIIGNPEMSDPKFNLAQFGDPDGVLGPASGGRGSGSGIGGGDGTGVGNHKGPGYGSLDGAGVSGIAKLAGVVSQPVLIYKIEPEYSDEARKAKLQGDVVLHIEVDARGAAQNIVVSHGLGLGLDERAIEAVRHWKFRPGYSNGKAVTTPALIQVTFRLL